MNRKTKISMFQIDEMVINLIEECYGFEFADISSHFYQLATQTTQTDPNIVGPLKPPTALTLTNRSTGKTFQVTKKVDTPQEVSVSIWVVRGFYPGTAIPYKMTVYKQHSDFYGDNGFGAKVVLGSFQNRGKMAYVSCSDTEAYIEEVAEKTLLDEPVNEDKKPTHLPKVYKCMSPKGLSLQKKTKKSK